MQCGVWRTVGAIGHVIPIGSRKLKLGVKTRDLQRAVELHRLQQCLRISQKIVEIKKILEAVREYQQGGVPRFGRVATRADSSLRRRASTSIKSPVSATT